MFHEKMQNVIWIIDAFVAMEEILLLAVTLRLCLNPIRDASSMQNGVVGN